MARRSVAAAPGVTSAPAAAAPPRGEEFARRYRGVPAESAKSEAGGGSLTQRFARVLPSREEEAGRKQAAGPVLGSFTVEQNGSQIRITDSDGSVYPGYLELAEKMPDASLALGAVMDQALPGASKIREASALEKPTNAPPAYIFRVVGTNQTANQRVVFSGRLITGADARGGAPATNGPGNYSISGSVVVGDGPPTAISAEPVHP